MAKAEIVAVTETSDPTGIVSKLSNVTTGVSFTTSSAPVISGQYSFTHWTVAGANGTRQQDALGRAVNPFAFIPLEPTSVVAHYLPTAQDTDSDGVADWYEVEFYGDLTQSSTSDTDLDGFSLAEERSRGYHPNLRDTPAEGGFSRRRSGAATWSDPRYTHLREVSDPVGIVDIDRVVLIGSTQTLSSAPVTSSGYSFVGWFRSGVRLDSSLDDQLPSVHVIAETTVTAKYLSTTEDIDAEGIPDWYEQWYFSSLSGNATSDNDADGFSTADEMARGYHPLLVDVIQEGGFSRRRSASSNVNLGNLVTYRLNSDPTGLMDVVATVEAGTLVTTPDQWGTLMGGYRFVEWIIDGVSQRDPLGVALGAFQFAAYQGAVATARYLPDTQDIDADGLPDWYELSYAPTLDSSTATDSDSDGFLLIEEKERGYNPLLVDQISEGGFSRRRSAAATANLQFFPASNVTEPGLGWVFSDPYDAVPGGLVMPGGASAPALGDVDGDGDLDLVVGGVGGAVRFLRNTGSPFSPELVEVDGALSGLVNWPAGPVYPALADWNGDGLADLVVGSDDGVLRFYEAQAGGSPMFAWVGNLAVGTNAVYPAFLPGVAGVDLLVLDAATGLVAQYAQGPGVPPYSLPATVINFLGTGVENGTGLAVADVTDDGIVDVIASDSAGRLWRFNGSAGGTFTLTSKVWGGSFNGFRAGLTATVVDFDGDGDPDIIGGGTDGALIFLRNPARHLRVNPAVVTMGTGEGLDFASVDNDGTLVWSMGPAQSGGSINAVTGHYVAGATPGIDQVVARNAAGRTGVAWINVVQRGGVEGSKWRALLVDGRRGPNDPVWPAANALNTRAREVLKYRGLSDNDILWLGHGVEADALPTRTGLASALSDGGAVAVDTEVLMVYLVDHGRVAPNGDGLFLLSENESISGTELDAWLDNLQSTRPGLSVVVVVESCFGTRVAGPMMAPDAYSSRRLVLTSSGTDELAHLAANGLVSYSSLWWSGVASGKSLGQAHADALAAMAGLQTPQTSSGGAGLGAGKLALESVAGSGRPVVSASGGDISLQGTQEARLTVAVESGFGLDKVWGVIVPPNYSPSGDEPVVDLPEVQLAKDPATGQWTALVGGFSEGGAPYTVLLQARDVWGQVSLPALLRVQQATVRNRVIIFASGEDAWGGASVAGSLAEYARESALLRRVRAEDIKMYADGALGVDTPFVATSASLQSAIEDWANADGQLGALTVFLVGEGSQEGLVCANGDTITPAGLKGWLDAQQEESGALVQLIVDADYSGAFVAESGNPHHRRIVVSSTGRTQRNTFATGRWSNVTRWIWNAIARGRDLRESYGEATDLAGLIGGSVPALFDDSGDGMFTKLKDGLKAINAFVGSAYVTADDPPFIGKASAAMSVASGQAARFWVSDIIMPAGAAPQAAWGEVVGPDGTSRGTVRLWQNVAKNRHEGSFRGFTEAGRYLIFIQAGTEGDPAMTTPPAVVQVHYASTPTTGAPATDGLPVLALPTDGQAMDVETDAGQEWRIDLLQGQRVAIEAREVSAQRDVALQVIGAGNQVLASADQWGAGFGETINGWEAPADGSYLVRASFAAGSGAAECRVRAYIKYESGPVDPVNLTPQTITFAQPASRSLSDGAFDLAATSSSGLPVRFEVVSGPATLAGTTLTPTAAGAVVVQALQDGSDEWESSEPVERTITITAETYESWAQGIFGADYASKGGRTQDADGDGQSNEAEWIARTNPNSAADMFKVEEASIQPAGFTLRWLARQGVTYRVMVSANLTTWTELPNTRITGNGTEVEVSDPVADRTKVFYRVEVVTSQ